MLRSVADLRIETTVTLAFVGTVLILNLYLTSVGLQSSHAPYYEMYGRSIAKGQLWVQEAASPAQCAFDLSFYKGRCYLYWGILPALIHLAYPSVSDRLATLVFCSIGLYFLLKIFSTLAPTAPRKDFERVAMPFFLFVAFGTNLPALCIAARVYEEAIAVAYACGFAGLYLAVPLLLGDGGRSSKPWLRPLASSGCLVMAGLCRLPWMIVAIAWNLWVFAEPLLTRRGLSVQRLVMVTTPVVLGCFLLLYLNDQRFDNPLDFGISKGTYTAAMIASGKDLTSIGNLGWNAAYNYFVGFPPLENPLTSDGVQLTYPWISVLFQERAVIKEFALGLFILMPSLLLGLRLLPTLGRGPKARGLVLASMGLPLALAALSIFSEVYRYQLEIYLPLLLLLVPPLLEDALKRRELMAVHWLSFLVPLPLTVVNTLWIVKTVCHRWGYC